MKIDTTRFGTIEVDDDMILTLKGGLLGFSDATSFVLIDHAPGSPFRWLQSAQIPKLAFVVIDPTQAIVDYPLELLKKSLIEIGVSEEEEIAVGVIVTFRRGAPGNTVNLIAPMCFGVDSKIGTQVVLHNTNLGTQHEIKVVKVIPEKEGEPPTAQLQINPIPLKTV